MSFIEKIRAIKHFAAPKPTDRLTHNAKMTMFTKWQKLFAVLGALYFVAYCIGNMRLASFIGASAETVHLIMDVYAVIVATGGFLAFVLDGEKSKE